MDIQAHLGELAELYRRHRHAILPNSFREPKHREISRRIGHSVDKIGSLGQSVEDLIIKTFGDKADSVAVFTIGSLGRLEATPESDTDLVVVLGNAFKEDEEQGKDNARDFYSNLVKTRVDLKFEHGNDIRRNFFDLKTSQQYPVLSMGDLLRDKEYASRRMQLLFESKVVCNHPMAEKVWQHLIGLYCSQPPSGSGTQLLYEDFTSFFQSFWQDYVRAAPGKMKNSRIIKLIMIREISLLTSALIIAYAYFTRLLTPGRWWEFLREANAPLTNKLLRWCEIPYHVSDEFAFDKSRLEVEQAIKDTINKLGDLNKSLFKSWLKGHQSVPLSLYPVSLHLIVLSELILADLNNFIELYSKPRFRESVDSLPTDMVTWHTNPALAHVWETRKSILDAVQVLTEVSLILVNWLKKHKIPVAPEVITYLEIARDQRIIPEVSEA